MMYKIYDNFLSKEDFKSLQFLEGTWFPWYMQERIAGQGDETRDHEDTYFTHLFYDQSQWNSEFQECVNPLLKKLNPKTLIRIKGNLYMKTSKRFDHNPHIDYPFKHKGAIFYINSNDGKTVLENGEEIDSVANRLLLFDASKPHNSTSCTNAKCRINININYYD